MSYPGENRSGQRSLRSCCAAACRQRCWRTAIRLRGANADTCPHVCSSNKPNGVRILADCDALVGNLNLGTSRAGWAQCELFPFHGYLFTSLPARLMPPDPGGPIIASRPTRPVWSPSHFAVLACDTTADFAEIIFAILGVAAKLERRRIRERTAAGPTPKRRASHKSTLPTNSLAPVRSRGYVWPKL